MYMSALTAIRCDPASRAYYQRKRNQGKRPIPATICLARRRTNVLYALIRDNRTWQPDSPRSLSRRLDIVIESPFSWALLARQAIGTKTLCKAGIVPGSPSAKTSSNRGRPAKPATSRDSSSKGQRPETSNSIAL